MDYIFWATAKNEEYVINSNVKKINQELKDLNGFLDSISNLLSLDIDSEMLLDEKSNLVKESLKNKVGIIIIDNWETVRDKDQEILNFLLRIPGKNKIIITSRYKIVDQQIKNVAPSPMMGAEGINFLKSWSQNFGDAFLLNLVEDTLLKIAEASGGIPIAMIMSLGQISLGKPIDNLIEELKEYEINDPLLDFCFSETYKRLLHVDKRILLSLTFFDEPITRKILHAMTEASARDLSESIQKLIQFSFIDVYLDDSDMELIQNYAINPITRSFLKQQLISVPKEKEFLEDNFQIISVELKNVNQIKISSMESVIDKLEYVSIEDKLAASFAASATRIWKTSRNWDEALRKFEKAKILSPNLGYIYGQWAWVCERANEYDLARFNYHKAIQYDEENIKLWYQWAMFELLRGDYREAEEKFNKVLSKAPDDARSWHGLARVHLLKYQAGEKEDLEKIEELLNRGYIRKQKLVASEIRHNSINQSFINKIRTLKTNISPKKIIHKQNTSKASNIILDGEIERIIDIGAYIKGVDTKTYFVHISNITSKNIKKVNQALNIGQKVQFKVLREFEQPNKSPEVTLILK